MLAAVTCCALRFRGRSPGEKSVSAAPPQARIAGHLIVYQAASHSRDRDNRALVQKRYRNWYVGPELGH